MGASIYRGVIDLPRCPNGFFCLFPLFGAFLYGIFCGTHTLAQVRFRDLYAVQSVALAAMALGIFVSAMIEIIHYQ